MTNNQVFQLVFSKYSKLGIAQQSCHSWSTTLVFFVKQSVDQWDYRRQQLLWITDTRCDTKVKWWDTPPRTRSVIYQREGSRSRPYIESGVPGVAPTQVYVWRNKTRPANKRIVFLGASVAFSLLRTREASRIRKIRRGGSWPPAGEGSQYIGAYLRTLRKKEFSRCSFFFFSAFFAHRLSLSLIVFFAPKVGPYG